MRISFRKSFRIKTKRNAALFLTPIAVASIVLLLYSQNQAAFATVWRNPLSLLSHRSPGKRDAGALYDTKPGHRRLSGLGEPNERVLAGIRERFGPPEERVLPGIRERFGPELADLLPSDAVPLDLIGGESPIFDEPGLSGLNLPSTGSTPQSPTGGGLGAPGAPGVVSLGAPSFTDPPQDSGQNPGQNPAMVTDPASAVPEPATWAMNFVGLFMIGAALRYWNRRRRALPSRPVPLLRE